MPTDSTKLSLSAASFLACSLGWFLTYAGWAFYVTATASRSGDGDRLVIGSWSAIFGILIWLCLYLPYALRHSRGPSWFYRLPGSVLIGIMIGLLGYFGFVYLFFCSSTPKDNCILFLHTSGIWWFPLFAAIVGAVAGLLFPFLQAALQRLQNRSTWGWPIVLAFVCVPGTLWILSMILWPAVQQYYPSVAYRYVDWVEQRQIYVQVLANTRVGDTLEMLREKLPQKFPADFHEDKGFMGRQFYAIEVNNGVVTSVYVTPPPKAGPSPSFITYTFPEGFTGWAHICYATPEAPPLPMKGRYMTIEFPASGLVVTSTPRIEGGHQFSYLRLGPDGPQKLPWQPKADKVGIVTKHSGGSSLTHKNRTATLRIVTSLFVGTNTQIKTMPKPRNAVDRCPPVILGKY